MKLQRIIASVCVAFVSLSCIQFVQAQGVGNLAVLPTHFQQQQPGGGWIIGPVGVVRDPAGPHWIKTLEDPDKGDFLAVPGQTFTIQEFLTIEGNLPWMDWHEEILTPGWEWEGPYFFQADGAAPFGLQVTTFPGDANHGGAVHFDFDPLNPGTSILIRKQLKFVGGSDGGEFFGKVEIAEYPTPEPASLALLSLGGLALMRRRRRIAR